MPLVFPLELIIGIGLGCAFAYLISFGVGKQATEDPNGRVLLGALGFLIALGTFGLWKKDLRLFWEIGLWFLACLTPVMIGGYFGGRKHISELEEKHASEVNELVVKYESTIAELKAKQYQVGGH
jgi:hypothetical protein